MPSFRVQLENPPHSVLLTSALVPVTHGRIQTTTRAVLDSGSAVTMVTKLLLQTTFK